jgi:hypothetical protein
MAKKIFLGDCFKYQPEYTKDQFLNTFFGDPDSILTMTQVMEGQLNARTYKGPRHQAMNNSWWKIATMTKSGIARWEDNYKNMMKVVPNLGDIATKLSQHYQDSDSDSSYRQGIEVPQELVDSLEGFEFKRDDFNYHSRTEALTIREILKDPILGGICGDNPEVLQRYLTALFETGGVPKRRVGGILESHLNVGCNSGVDNPTIDFYRFDFSGGPFSNSPISRYIKNPGGFSEKYPTIIQTTSKVK